MSSTPSHYWDAVLGTKRGRVALQGGALGVFFSVLRLWTPALRGCMLSSRSFVRNLSVNGMNGCARMACRPHLTSQDPEVLSAPPSPIESMSMGTPSPRHVPCGASRALAVPAETRRNESRSRSPKLLKEWDVRLIVRDELTRMLAEVKPPSPPQSGLAKEQPLNYLVPAKASQPPFGMFPLGAGKVTCKQSA